MFGIEIELLIKPKPAFMDRLVQRYGWDPKVDSNYKSEYVTEQTPTGERSRGSCQNGAATVQLSTPPLQTR